MKMAACLALGLVLLVAGAARSSEPTVLEFQTMVAVTDPFVGVTNPIRDIPGGGLPWMISEGRGELRADGKLEVKVRGLVLVSTGKNPIPAFRAVVSCLTSVSGSPATGNVSTDPFPATPDGNADIEATITLPSPCIAPIVFVTRGTGAAPGAWFAATGR